MWQWMIAQAEQDEEDELPPEGFEAPLKSALPPPMKSGLPPPLKSGLPPPLPRPLGSNNQLPPRLPPPLPSRLPPPLPRSLPPPIATKREANPVLNEDWRKRAKVEPESSADVAQQPLDKTKDVCYKCNQTGHW